jgi:hypothetical protein
MGNHYTPSFCTKLRYNTRCSLPLTRLPLQTVVVLCRPRSPAYPASSTTTERRNGAPLFLATTSNHISSASRSLGASCHQCFDVSPNHARLILEPVADTFVRVDVCLSSLLRWRSRHSKCFRLSTSPNLSCYTAAALGLRDLAQQARKEHEKDQMSYMCAHTRTAPSHQCNTSHLNIQAAKTPQHPLQKTW